MTISTTQLPDTLGGRLRHYRQRCGYSREEVARLIGRQRGAIQDYERGQRTPNLKMLRTLADLYQISIAQLLGPDWR